MRRPSDGRPASSASPSFSPRSPRRQVRSDLTEAMTIADDDVPNGAALLARAKGGDQDAFERLTEPYRREVQLHCYRMLGSLHDAEDLVQETFLRAWRGLARFEGRGLFRGGVCRIADTACLNAMWRMSGDYRLY